MNIRRKELNQTQMKGLYCTCYKTKLKNTASVGPVQGWGLKGLKPKFVLQMQLWQC